MAKARRGMRDDGLIEQAVEALYVFIEVWGAEKSR
jgi:hypothetical protein